MRRFRIDRFEDETGVSGTGTAVLRGVVTPAGKVFVEWRMPRASMGVYNSLDEFVNIHVLNHPSATMFVWDDDPDGRPDFVLKATDKIAPRIVAGWIELASQHDEIPREKVKRAQEHLDLMIDWQRVNADKVKWPD